MRKERTKSGFKVWLTDDDLEALRRAAASRRDDLIIQLDGFVGLRAFKIPQIQPQHVRRVDDVLSAASSTPSVVRDGLSFF